MEVFAAELAARLVEVMLRPSSLAACVVVPLVLTSGAAGRVVLLIEEKNSTRHEPMR